MRKIIPKRKNQSGLRAEPAADAGAGSRPVELPKQITWRWYFGCVAVYALVFHFWQVEPVPISVYAAGVLIWAVCLMPLAIWYRGGRKSVPIFELICLAYGAAYGPPIYLVPNEIFIQSQPLRLSWTTTLECLLFATLGASVLIGGYYGVLRLLQNFSLPRMDLPMRPEKRWLYICVALGCGLAVSLAASLATQADSTYAAIFRLLGSQFDLGIVLLAYEVFSARRPSIGRLALLVVCTSIGVLLALTGGMLEGVVLPIVLVLIVRWQVRKKFPIGIAAFGCLLFLLLNPIKHEYRERTWYGEDSDSGLMQRLGLWTQLVGEHLQGSDGSGVESPSGFNEAIQRVDLLHKFVHVKTMTPREIPYLGGLSYEYMLYTYIPRMIWPEKPLATEATDLVDFAYGFRSPLEENKGTKIAIGQIAEAYANLGWPGIIAVMLIQGVFFAMLNYLFNGPRSVGARAIYLVVMVVFLNGIGTSAVILFGAIMQFLIAGVFLMRPFATGFRSGAEAAPTAPPARSRRARSDARRDGPHPLPVIEISPPAGEDPRG